MKLLSSLALFSLGFLGTVAIGCVNTDSGSQITDRTAPPGACGEIETHVIGIYDAPNGEATVQIDRPGRHVLVVSAYEATRWHVNLAPGAELVHVYAVGYHPQTVDVPAGVDVMSDSFMEGGTYACGYSYPYDGAGCDTEQLFRLSSLRVHHAATTFHGCREAGSWTIGEDLATLSDCSSDAGSVQNDWIGGCTAASETSPDDQPSCGGGPL